MLGFIVQSYMSAPLADVAAPIPRKRSLSPPPPDDLVDALSLSRRSYKDGSAGATGEDYLSSSRRSSRDRGAGAGAGDYVGRRSYSEGSEGPTAAAGVAGRGARDALGGSRSGRPAASKNGTANKYVPR